MHDGDPVGVLHRLNTAVHAQYQGDDPRYCTVIFGVLTRDGDGFTVTLASGGHPPALLLRADGGADYQHPRRPARGHHGRGRLHRRHRPARAR